MFLLLLRKLLHEILPFVVASLSCLLSLNANTSGYRVQTAGIAWTPQRFVQKLYFTSTKAILLFFFIHFCFLSNSRLAIIILLPSLFTNLAFRASLLLMSKYYPTCALLLYHEDKSIKSEPAVIINNWKDAVYFTAFCPTWN